MRPRVLIVYARILLGAEGLFVVNFHGGWGSNPLGDFFFFEFDDPPHNFCLIVNGKSLDPLAPFSDVLTWSNFLEAR